LKKVFDQCLVLGSPPPRRPNFSGYFASQSCGTGAGKIQNFDPFLAGMPSAEELIEFWSLSRSGSAMTWLAKVPGKIRPPRRRRLPRRGIGSKTFFQALETDRRILLAFFLKLTEKPESISEGLYRHGSKNTGKEFSSKVNSGLPIKHGRSE